MNRPAKLVCTGGYRSSASILLPRVIVFVVCDLTLCLSIQSILSLVSTEEVAKDHSLEDSLFIIHLVVTVILILSEFEIIILFLFTGSVNITNFSEKIPVK